MALVSALLTTRNDFRGDDLSEKAFAFREPRRQLAHPLRGDEIDRRQRVRPKVRALGVVGCSVRYSA